MAHCFPSLPEDFKQQNKGKSKHIKISLLVIFLGVHIIIKALNKMLALLFFSSKNIHWENTFTHVPDTIQSIVINIIHLFSNFSKNHECNTHGTNLGVTISF